MHSTAAEALLQSNGGQIQVIQATPEQVAQLQQAHQIQILQADATQVIAGVSLAFRIHSQYLHKDENENERMNE